MQIVNGIEEAPACCGPASEIDKLAEIVEQRAKKEQENYNDEVNISTAPETFKGFSPANNNLVHTPPQLYSIRQAPATLNFPACLLPIAFCFYFTPSL